MSLFSEDLKVQGMFPNYVYRTPWIQNPELWSFFLGYIVSTSQETLKFNCVNLQFDSVQASLEVKAWGRLCFPFLLPHHCNPATKHSFYGNGSMENGTLCGSCGLWYSSGFIISKSSIFGNLLLKVFKLIYIHIYKHVRWWLHKWNNGMLQFQTIPNAPDCQPLILIKDSDMF